MSGEEPIWSDSLDDLSHVYVPASGIVNIEVSGGDAHLKTGDTSGWIASEIISAPPGYRYDFVLLSGGSVLDDSMALALAPHVGGVLLLVVENKTTVEGLDAAQDALSLCKARKVGLVLTTRVKGGRWPISGAPRR